jgi:hypothetical protein
VRDCCGSGHSYMLHKYYMSEEGEKFEICDSFRQRKIFLLSLEVKRAVKDIISPAEGIDMIWIKMLKLCSGYYTANNRRSF